MTSEMKKGKVLGVIPARMASSRFPGKPIKAIKGKPMIWHVWKRSSLSKLVDEVVIATCDEEIRKCAEDFGARVIMTSDQHLGANDRVGEVAEKVPCEIILNIQGDEPLVNPKIIDEVVAKLQSDPSIRCVNPVSEITTEEELNSPNTVKVVSNLKSKALYFSRYPVPSDLVKARKCPVYRQVPFIGFRSDFCVELGKLSKGPLELQEGCDLLRAVEHSIDVDIIVTKMQTIGVDTPQDLVNVEKALEQDPLYQEYGSSQMEVAKE